MATRTFLASMGVDADLGLELLGRLLDAQGCVLAVLDEGGTIQGLQRSGILGPRLLNPLIEAMRKGVDFPALCDAQTGPDQPYAKRLSDGFREVARGESSEFACEPADLEVAGTWRFMSRICRVLDTEPARILVIFWPIHEVVRPATETGGDQARRRSVQEPPQEGTWELDLSTGESRWSSQMFRLLHRDPANEPPGFDELVASLHPEDRPQLLVARSRPPASGDTREFALRTYPVMGNGPMLYLSATLRCLYDDAGNPALFKGTLVDVTEGKKYETEIARLNRLYGVLSQVNQAMVRASHPESFLRKVCRVIVEEGGFHLCWIGRAEAADRRVQPVAVWGEDAEYVQGLIAALDDRPEGHGPAANAFREGLPHVCNNFFADPTTLPWRERADCQQIQSSATFPIWREEKVWAVLALYSSEIGYFGDREVMLLEEAALDIGFSLENLENQARRRRAVEDLRRSEEQFRTLVESAPQGIVIQTHGRFAYANPSAVRMFKALSAESLIGKDVLEYYHAEDRSLLLERFRSTGEGRRPFPMTEKRIVSPDDGTIFWVEIVAVPITFEGQPSALVFLHDITERKQAEEALRASEKRIALAIEAARMGTWDWDLHSGRIVWSAGDAELFGFADDAFESNQESFDKRVHPEDREAVRKDVEHARAAHSRYQHEYRVVLPDGSVRWIAGSGRFLYDEAGEATRMIGVVMDVTARKEQQRQLEENAAQLKEVTRRILEVQEAERRYLARELHDQIGQSLTAMKLDLEWASRKSDELSERLKETIELVDQTLQQARGIALDLRPSLLDDLGLVAALEWYVRRHAERTGMKGNLEVDPEGLTVAPDIATACFRAVQEALTNVARHSQASRFSVELTQHSKGLDLVVRDDGIGFDPVAAMAGTIRGASLGLAGLRERVELAGGHVEFVSEPGKGSEVQISFPGEGSGKRGPSKGPLP